MCGWGQIRYFLYYDQVHPLAARKFLSNCKAYDFIGVEGELLRFLNSNESTVVIGLLLSPFF